jgi:hypothetical protein
MAQSLNLTALNSNLNAYCREHNSKLFADTLLGMTDIFQRSGVMVWDGVKDETPLVNMAVSDIVKPRNYTSFDPTANAIAFKNRLLKTRGWKVDLMIYPMEFEKTWLAHNAQGRRTIKDWEDVPFYQFIVEQILKKVQGNIRKASYRGVYDAGGSTFTDICDGFVTLMKADVTAGNIPTVTLGSVTTTNVIEKLETMAKDISAEYSNELVYMNVSREVFDMYVTADPTAVGRMMYINEVPGQSPASRQEIYLRVGNVKLVRNIDLVHTSPKTEVFCTIDQNLVVGTNTMSDLNEIRFQEFERGVKMLMDGTWGVNYALANSTYKPIICSDAFVV